jgi:hypothetical protein
MPAAVTAGVLVDVGVIAAAADRGAIAWHAYFWDPWFALWGIASTIAMWRSRPGSTARRGTYSL